MKTIIRFWCDWQERKQARRWARLAGATDLPRWEGRVRCGIRGVMAVRSSLFEDGGSPSSRPSPPGEGVYVRNVTVSDALGVSGAVELGVILCRITKT